MGFLTYGISRSSILQVESDYKRLGIGRVLVECGIADEVVKGNSRLMLRNTFRLWFWSIQVTPFTDRVQPSCPERRKASADELTDVNPDWLANPLPRAGCP